MACHRFGRFPCGKCGGCLDSRSSAWAVRLFHERSAHEDASFITLTFRDDPIHVWKDVAQRFLKRLRKLLEPKRIRYFLVSEYGERTLRPHYHALIFGHDFSKDPGAYEVRKGLFSSPLLERAWGEGNVSSGEVTPASIRYVSNYLLPAEEAVDVAKLSDAVQQQNFDFENGHPIVLEPVFALMSRNPGIGAGWIDAHAEETYKDDTVQVAGFSRRPPRYYDKRVFGDDPDSAVSLAVFRRELSLRIMSERPRTYLKNIAPERRLASGKIWRSRKNLNQGEL